MIVPTKNYTISPTQKPTITPKDGFTTTIDNLAKTLIDKITIASIKGHITTSNVIKMDTILAALTNIIIRLKLTISELWYIISDALIIDTIN